MPFCSISLWSSSGRFSYHSLRWVGDTSVFLFDFNIFTEADFLFRAFTHGFLEASCGYMCFGCVRSPFWWLVDGFLVKTIRTGNP